MLSLIHAAASGGSENIARVGGVNGGMKKQEGDRYFHSTQITGIPLISNVTICFNWICSLRHAEAAPFQCRF